MPPLVTPLLSCSRPTKRSSRTAGWTRGDRWRRRGRRSRRRARSRRRTGPQPSRTRPGYRVTVGDLGVTQRWPWGDPIHPVLCGGTTHALRTRDRQCKVTGRGRQWRSFESCPERQKKCWVTKFAKWKSLHMFNEGFCSQKMPILYFRPARILWFLWNDRRLFHFR